MLTDSSTKGANPRVLPEHVEPPGASERVRVALNGASAGSAELWDASAGDYLLATITDVELYRSRYGGRETTRLSLLVHEGTEAGRHLLPDVHRVLLCQHEELRKMVRKLDPRAHDTLILSYHGRDDSRRPSRHLFRYSIEKSDRQNDGQEF